MRVARDFDELDLRVVVLAAIAGGGLAAAIATWAGAQFDQYAAGFGLLVALGIPIVRPATPAKSSGAGDAHPARVLALIVAGVALLVLFQIVVDLGPAPRSALHVVAMSWFVLGTRLVSRRIGRTA
jgi:hypothetical protein